MRYLLIGLFVLFIIPPLSARERIIIATGEYPPYLSQFIEHNGVGLRIIREAFNLMNIDVEYRFYPWKRAYSNAESGICDATATWTWTEEREKAFLYSDPLYTVVDVFFHRRDNPVSWSELDDLIGLRLGATRGYSYTEEYLRKAKSGLLQVEMENSDLLNIRKLMKGHIDAFPINIDVGYELIYREYGTRGLLILTHSPTPLRTIETHLLFSRNYEKHEEMTILFNMGLNILRDRGKVDEYFRDSRIFVPH